MNVGAFSEAMFSVGRRFPRFPPALMSAMPPAALRAMRSAGVRDRLRGATRAPFYRVAGG